MFETIGALGTIIICWSGIPQVVKTCRTKRAGDLSIAYLLSLMAGLCLLQVYCLYVRDPVFIFGNTLSLATTGLLIACWFRYRESPSAKAHGSVPEIVHLAGKGPVQ